MSGENGIDEAFAFLSENVTAYTDLGGRLRDDEAGVRMEIEELGIDTLVELDVRVADDGSVRLGCAPPLYRVATTVEPVFHHLSFRAVATSGTVESV